MSNWNYLKLFSDLLAVDSIESLKDKNFLEKKIVEDDKRNNILTNLEKGNKKEGIRLWRMLIKELGRRPEVLKIYQKIYKLLK